MNARGSAARPKVIKDADTARTREKCISVKRANRMKLNKSTWDVNESVEEV